GGGPGGYTAALRAAASGRQVTLVDREGDAGLGGVCLHSGCIPSKALIEHALAIDAARALVGDGSIAVEVESDLTAWQGRQSAMIEQLRAGIERSMRSGAVRVVRGLASLNR